MLSDASLISFALLNVLVHGHSLASYSIFRLSSAARPAVRQFPSYPVNFEIILHRSSFLSPLRNPLFIIWPYIQEPPLRGRDVWFHNYHIPIRLIVFEFVVMSFAPFPLLCHNDLSFLKWVVILQQAHSHIVVEQAMQYTLLCYYYYQKMHLLHSVILI